MESNIPFDPNSPLHLFVVDDDKFYSQLICKYYDMKPEISISVFSDAESCIVAQETIPNIILLDYHLYDPLKDNMDGDKAIAALRSKYPDAIVVMISGDKKQEIKQSSELKGAFEFIMKNKETFSNFDEVLLKCRHLIAYNEKYKDAEFSD